MIYCCFKDSVLGQLPIEHLDPNALTFIPNGNNRVDKCVDKCFNAVFCIGMGSLDRKSVKMMLNYLPVIFPDAPPCVLAKVMDKLRSEFIVYIDECGNIHFVNLKRDIMFCDTGSRDTDSKNTMHKFGRRVLGLVYGEKVFGTNV